MKKIFRTVLVCLLLAALSVTFIACDNSPEQTYKGIGQMEWHDKNNIFIASVAVTVKDGVVTKLAFDENASNVNVGSWQKAYDGLDAYLTSFVGKKVSDLLAMKVTPTDTSKSGTPNYHFDGGSIDGVISVISGASATSTTIAIAVQNALKKIK